MQKIDTAEKNTAKNFAEKQTEKNTAEKLCRKTNLERKIVQKNRLQKNPFVFLC